MRLDVSTISFVTSLVFVVQTIAVFVQYRINKDFGGLGWWFLGAALQALGFLLILAFDLPAIWKLAILANPSIFLGQVFLNLGIVKFLNRKESPWISASLFAAFALVYFSFIFLDNSIFARSILVSGSAAVIGLKMAYLLFKARRGGFKSSAGFTALVFLLFGSLQTLMTFATLILPHLSSYQDFYDQPIRSFAFIIPTVASMLWTFGFILMANQRLNAENLGEREKIRDLLAEKEIILREVHHRIKNNMSTICSLLSLQAAALKDPAAIAAFEDTENRIQSMMVLYDTLYRSSSFTDLPVQDYLPPLIDALIANFPNAASVRVEKEIESFVLDVKRLQSIGIIINELLTNCMKYAFAGRDEGLVRVSATRTDRHVVIIVQDNGRGMAEAGESGAPKGFGLPLVEALAGQLGGTFRMELEGGTKAVLEFEQ